MLHTNLTCDECSRPINIDKGQFYLVMKPIDEMKAAMTNQHNSGWHFCCKSHLISFISKAEPENPYNQESSWR